MQEKKSFYMSPATPAWVKLALILGASEDPLADVAEEKSGEQEQLHHPGGR